MTYSPPGGLRLRTVALALLLLAVSSAGFAVDTNRVTLLGADSTTIEALPLLSKAEVAERIVQRMIALLGGAG